MTFPGHGSLFPTLLILMLLAGCTAATPADTPIGSPTNSAGPPSVPPNETGRIERAQEQGRDWPIQLSENMDGTFGIRADLLVRSESACTVDARLLTELVNGKHSDAIIQVTVENDGGEAQRRTKWTTGYDVHAEDMTVSVPRMGSTSLALKWEEKLQAGWNVTVTVAALAVRQGTQNEPSFVLGIDCTGGHVDARLAATRQAGSVLFWVPGAASSGNGASLAMPVPVPPLTVAIGEEGSFVASSIASFTGGFYASHLHTGQFQVAGPTSRTWTMEKLAVELNLVGGPGAYRLSADYYGFSQAVVVAMDLRAINDMRDLAPS